MKPLVIFKNAAIKEEWREVAPSGYLLRASSSGYIDFKIFFEYDEECEVPEKSKHSSRKEQGPAPNGSAQVTPF